MKYKPILLDKRAQGGMISFFVGAMLAVVIALNVAWPVMDASIYGGQAAATGTLVFSGNVSNGELVNITNGNAVYRFEFNTTGTDPATDCRTVNCIRVNVQPSFNKSIWASGNLTTAINANASVAAFLTAVNTTNTTTLTYNTMGTAGNAIGLAETGTNIAKSGTVLSGGANSATNNMSSSAATLIDQLPLFLVLVLLMVFVKAII